ncbi:HAMP domain-containing sensor histidine kinase [Actinomadura sp. DC4]|uniref:sensor histidine kinase n=1 Tax=Actinomadura sp. DC4 TaxID=3055069 RepID=UPI0025B110B4|nr:HAMP domain-containing sensor histidine kinase [Actinomadura sp. DC4]MDN3353664.1 HAMP domain-containing sensor histidine kinase [Actinomadura sp. DC4]
MRARSGPDRQMLSRVRRTLTVQLATAVTVVVALVGTIVYLSVSTGQRRDSERELRGVIASGAVENAPPCVFVFAVEGGAIHRTPNAPAALPVRADLRATGTVVRRHRINGIDYLMRTEHHGSAVVQAALDRRYEIQERRRLYTALIIAELAGLAAALVTGQLLARRAIRPLAEALERQRRFVADASHELRTPLTRLHTRAQLLARRTDSDELRAIVADTRRFGEVIEDLLLSAQLPPRAAEGRPVDLAAVVRSLVSAEAARAESRATRLTLTGADAPCVVAGVESALSRVVGALLDNAIGHTLPGGHVQVALRRGEGQVELVVRDDGVGLDPRDTERIFQRFTRGMLGEGRRFGLGLALVREVVESHGGTVEAAGRPGEGAAFTVRLPAAPEQAPVPTGRRPHRTPRAQVG